MGEFKKLNTKSYLFKIILLFLLSLGTSIFCLGFGSAEIDFTEIINIFLGNSNSAAVKIIYEIRLPRIILAFLVGGGLSVAGAVFQAILMNPLAEPYILGISSGGAFGAVFSLLLGLSFIGTQALAFAGSCMVVFLVFILGKRFGELESNVLLLTGVMVGAFFSAILLVLVTFLDSTLRSAVFWLIGNLSLAQNDSIYYVAPVVIITSGFLILNGQKFNVLAMGTTSAKRLGVNTKILVNVSYIIVSAMIGSIVSVSGIIGFVGLLIPHICRLIFGLDNRIIIPASFFLGAAYLVIADTIGRTVIAPSELPVGAVTAILGSPVFIYLLRRRFNSVN
ncbi:MAG: iron ABC transporter permease [Ignavibacteria bacterium]|nr:iron ABC transporter permease [Ignavibacteria bacterium]